MKPELNDKRFTLLEETNLAPTLIWLQPGKCLVNPARILEASEENGTTTFTLADVNNGTTTRTYDGPLADWIQYREAQDAWFTRPRQQEEAATPEAMAAFRQAMEMHAETLEPEPEDCETLCEDPACEAGCVNEATKEEPDHATTA